MLHLSDSSVFKVLYGLFPDVTKPANISILRRKIAHNSSPKMKKYTGTIAAVLTLFLFCCSLSSASQITFKDIVGSGSTKSGARRFRFKGLGGRFGRGSRRIRGGLLSRLRRFPSRHGSTSAGGDISKKQFLVIAQAKLIGSGRTHPSTPQVNVDVDPKIPGCGLFDWLFNSRCSASTPRSNVRLPKFRTMTLPRAILHIFDLPYGWKNARVTLPSFGRCRHTRTAVMRAASSFERRCRTAQFRARNGIARRRCWFRTFRNCSFWRCKRRRRYVCRPRPMISHRECSRTYLVLRVFTLARQIPQVLATTGTVYTGFRSCNDAAAAAYFRK